MIHTSLVPWLDPATLIGHGTGVWALVIVCAILFAETGLLVGFILPGDTLLFFTGLLTVSGVIPLSVWWVCLAAAAAAFVGGELGYLIGRTAGPRVFERKESGFFSVKNVERTNRFFERFGPLAVVLARFIPVVRTFAPVAAGVGRMGYRRYSLYNAIGGVIWTTGIIVAGYLLGRIPWISRFAQDYMDLVLLAVVFCSVVPMALHYLRSSLRARKAREAGQEDDAQTLPVEGGR